MAGVVEGKVAIITGAARGQGLAAAKLFAAEGATVVVNDLDVESVEAAVAELKAAGGAALGAPGDVSDAAAVEAIVGRAVREFGGLDILYNNAGIGYSATSRMGIGMEDVVRCTLEDWQRILDINLGGVFHFCKYGIPALIERGGGAVINTASIAALRGSRNAHAYGASKGAIVALTRSLAVTYGRNGIRANAICPGIIDTEMIHETLLGSDTQVAGLQRMTPVGSDRDGDGRRQRRPLSGQRCRQVRYRPGDPRGRRDHGLAGRGDVTQRRGAGTRTRRSCRRRREPPPRWRRPALPRDACRRPTRGPRLMPSVRALRPGRRARRYG